MPRHCYVLRVFTRDKEGGNALGVVTDILGLDDDKMQRIASDLGFSETIFLRWFDEPRPNARIFTPTYEMPFAGHPLVGAAWLLLNLGPQDPGAIECSVGTIGISSEGPTTWIKVEGSQPVEPIEVDLGGWLKPKTTVVVDMPLRYLLVEVESPTEVSEASVPDDGAGFDSIYVWAWAAHDDVVKARFFIPGAGIPEDPATGSAAVALASHLRSQGRDEGELVIEQGAEMGHPSTIHLRWDRSLTFLGGEVQKDEVRFLSI
ncbi:MAG: PhzF family phenazine biosynthesis protein [Acidimicrobiia bacterium]